MTVIDITSQLDRPWHTLGFESGPPLVRFVEVVDRYHARSRELLDAWSKAQPVARRELRDQQVALDEALHQIAGVQVHSAWSQAGTPDLPFEVPFAYRNVALQPGAAQRLGPILALHTACSQRVALVLKTQDSYQREVIVLRSGEPKPGNHLLVCFPGGEVVEVTDGEEQASGLPSQWLAPGVTTQWGWQILLRDGRAVPPQAWRPTQDLAAPNAELALQAAARANAGDLTLYYTSRCLACLHTWEATFPDGRCDRCGESLRDDAHNLKALPASMWSGLG